MILAIESSCDESAIALFDPLSGLVEERIFSQIDLHAHYGGVVPDLASREHLKYFPILLEQLNLSNYAEDITQIAVTYGPGLAGCLSIGVMLAKGLAFAYDLPLVGINHLRAHAWSPFISLHESDPAPFTDLWDACFPHLGLLVSGGNTLLFEIDCRKNIHILAQTVDDAVGEALDKGGKLMGLAYPAGPKIEALSLEGDASAYEFPKAMAQRADARFSFSGLKTSLRYRLDAMNASEIAQSLPSICASYQSAVMLQLIEKTKFFLNKNAYRSIGLSGGVANNQYLRAAFDKLSDIKEIPFFGSMAKHSGDNAGMIAFAAFVDPGGAVTEHPEHPLKIVPALTLTE
ncbi:MAG: tRNA (adenosine(37)-N6)-threonylcarbamoyltransferase complex transferase subunit TsaD [Puniceicoccaceae bacterium]|nr:tRNA (adenosine(37)-N6)-threonylcarbamoyltransferase complex transferase subunit TsaD [Puniceicoccaceae bacterium]